MWYTCVHAHECWCPRHHLEQWEKCWFQNQGNPLIKNGLFHSEFVKQMNRCWNACDLLSVCPHYFVSFSLLTSKFEVLWRWSGFFSNVQKIGFQFQLIMPAPNTLLFFPSVNPFCNTPHHSFLLMHKSNFLLSNTRNYLSEHKHFQVK